jgi:uncharacterized protein (DUF58 family)
VKERKAPSIYPTASFGGLLFVLVAMWYAASSQNSAAAYLLLFALTAIFLVSIPHTLINLAGVTIALESVKPAFAGQEISLPVEIMNGSRATRHGISVTPSHSGRERKRVEALLKSRRAGWTRRPRRAHARTRRRRGRRFHFALQSFSTKPRIDHIPAGKAARVTLRFPARQRGEHKIGTLCLTSVYPLGFIRVLKKFATSQTYVVYPRPAGDLQLPVSSARLSHSRSQADIREGDDFAGVRAYVQGESQRHIDWKAVARGQTLMTKQFAAEA